MKMLLLNVVCNNNDHYYECKLSLNSTRKAKTFSSRKQIAGMSVVKSNETKARAGIWI